MKVLAFDPGFERLGAAVVAKEGAKESLVFSHCFRTSASLPFAERLALLGGEAEALIKKHKPSCVALEKVYFEKNAKTAMQVAQVVGMLSYLAAKAKLPLYEYTPLEVKAAMTGFGKSDKRAMFLMVARLVRLPEKNRLDDEVDAIAVGLTCLASVRAHDYPQAVRRK